MTKICTSLEQSKKLIELGINIDTSDMVYLRSYFEEEEEYNLLVGSYHEGYMEKDDGTLIPIFDEHIPAWSLVALLGLMPRNESKTISLCLGGSNGIEHTFDWFCTCDENEEPYGYKTFHSDNPIDCTFEMVVWLKENNKL